MKSYTDIEQSKKLAEILSIESADMHYCLEQRDIADGYEIGITPYIKAKNFIGKCNIINVQPSWSLAALLRLMPKHIKQNDGRTYKFHIFNDDGIVIQRWGCSYCAEDFHNRAEYLSDPHLKYPTNVYSDKYEDPVDACYEMIIKLHELNLL